MIKSGSIVVCLPVNIAEKWKEKVIWMPVMDKKTPHMVREVYPDILDSENLVVVFEEGTIGYNDNGAELCFPMSHVREVEEISEEELLQEILEMFIVEPAEV